MSRHDDYTMPMVRHEGIDPSELLSTHEDDRMPSWHITVWSLVGCALVGVWIMALSGGPQ